MNEKINLEKLGNVAQIADIKEIVHTDGLASGLKELVCKNGRLRMNILAGRAFDIGELSFGGINLSYIGKNGFISPFTAYTEAFPYPRSFSGGFLMTCGLDNIGSPSASSPQHGKLSSTPACITKKEVLIPDGSPVLRIAAETVQAELFGENLTVLREYEIRQNGFTLTDNITNRGFKPASVIFMYHFNMGYPFLDENTELSVNAKSVEGHDQKAEKTKKNAAKFAPPKVDFTEECFYYSFAEPETHVSVFNPKLSLKASFSYANRNLPYLIEWKNPLSGEYVLGIEPSSSKLNDKSPTTLAPGQTLSNSITVCFE
ncbi:MAG: aldose 1-epimerase family protein [Clostridiaceae bacterium]|jgi:hypothetical protein|nr:aldose 1-epimerase family protein [Clostridiaceae bacterium]